MLPSDAQQIHSVLETRVVEHDCQVAFQPFRHQHSGSHQ
ncbi:hypothetical protein ThidrDRAFT_2510 [Thiorhodococcus drewsii AZ1]|uniref:Uncharacterized protein n=1 Tax=Thiorhodococcus drewsii AZ1 TaxID=765913 RepID=G2E2G2_9GAMM|nr:hypothetical protein ThidrDRAFT_2510 [Thiorhodococcus drewsii AZ1]